MKIKIFLLLAVPVLGTPHFQCGFFNHITGRPCIQHLENSDRDIEKISAPLSANSRHQTQAHKAAINGVQPYQSLGSFAIPIHVGATNQKRETIVEGTPEANEKLQEVTDHLLKQLELPGPGNYAVPRYLLQPIYDALADIMIHSNPDEDPEAIRERVRENTTFKLPDGITVSESKPESGPAEVTKTLTEVTVRPTTLEQTKTMIAMVTEVVTAGPVTKTLTTELLRESTVHITELVTMVATRTLIEEKVKFTTVENIKTFIEAGRATVTVTL